DGPLSAGLLEAVLGGAPVLPGVAERPVGIGRAPQENLDVGYMISLIHQLAVREPGDCENATVHQLESLLKGFSAAQRASHRRRADGRPSAATQALAEEGQR
ncbi:hypothetical protein, partial [Streptomyces anthocyanicus]